MSIVTFIDRHASTTIDSPRTRQMWTSMQNDSSLDISQITPTLFPTEKRPFGVDLKVNAHGEHVIAAVWPGHAAAHTKIAAGSVLVRQGVRASHRLRPPRRLLRPHLRRPLHVVSGCADSVRRPSARSPSMTM